MSLIRTLLARMRGLYASRQDEARLDEEIETHIALLAAELESQGIEPAAARAQARREFGGATQIREQHREQRGFPWIESVLQDLRLAIRQLWQNPGFAATAIVTLALGIGANAAIFNLLDTVVLQPLPVDHPEELVLLRTSWIRGGERAGAVWLREGERVGASMTYPQFQQLSEQQTVVESVFAANSAFAPDATIDGHKPSRELRGSIVTEHYFEGLRVRAHRGRMIAPEEFEPGADPVIVISYGTWQREFAAAEDVIGKTINLDYSQPTIIGVAPPEFFGEQFGINVDFWIPLSRAGTAPGFSFGQAVYAFRPMARLRSDVSAPAAEAALKALYEQLAGDSQLRDVTAYELDMEPGSRGMGTLHTEFGGALWLLTGVVGLVALLSSCNLANLLLARATSRHHEIGVRLALGARRTRLIRQLLTESTVLATVGAGIGFGISILGARALTVLALGEQAEQVAVGSNLRVALFTALVAITALCTFGLVPALTATRVPVNAALQASRRTVFGGGIHRAAAMFVVAQVALCLLLVAGSSLLVRSFWQLTHQDFGYQPEGILLANMPFTERSLRGGTDPNFQNQLRESIQAIPGVEAASLQLGGPLGGVTEQGKVSLPDRPASSDQEARVILTSEGYFEAMGIPILRGRPITDQDREDSAKVAVITTTAARLFFGSQDPIGQLFTNGDQFDPQDTIEVVGVVGDLRSITPRTDYEPILFLPIQQARVFTTLQVAASINGAPGQYIAPFNQALGQLAPDTQFSEIYPLMDTIAQQVRRDRLLAWLSGSFGVLALVLAAVGLYGVIAYTAQQRTGEIGIRLALGATPGQMRGMLMKDVVQLLMIGLTIGGGATLLLTGYLESILFELAPHDPATLVAAFAILSAVAILAGYLPARRASKLDPMIALRDE